MKRLIATLRARRERQRIWRLARWLVARGVEPYCAVRTAALMRRAFHTLRFTSAGVAMPDSGGDPE